MVKAELCDALILPQIFALGISTCYVTEKGSVSANRENPTHQTVAVPDLEFPSTVYVPVIMTWFEMIFKIKQKFKYCGYLR